MTVKKLDNLGIYGPVNGMGERDLRGDYFLASLTFEDDELVRGRLTKGQLEEIRDAINVLLAAPKESDLSRAVKEARGGDAPVPFRGFA